MKQMQRVSRFARATIEIGFAAPRSGKAAIRLAQGGFLKRTVTTSFQAEKYTPEGSLLFGGACR